MAAFRERRSNAGRNRWYDEREYCLVSFRDKNKHALVPTTVVNQDPIDDCGTVKISGRRREILVVAKASTYWDYIYFRDKNDSTHELNSTLCYSSTSGSKSEMNERASRFGKASGSEEVEVADLCEHEPREENEMEDDSEYQGNSEYRAASSPSKSRKSKDNAHISTNKTTSADTVLKSISNITRHLPKSTSSLPSLSAVPLVRSALPSSVIRQSSDASESVTTASNSAAVDEELDFSLLYDGRKRKQSRKLSLSEDEENQDPSDSDESVVGLARKPGYVRPKVDLSQSRKRTKRLPKNRLKKSKANESEEVNECERISRRMKILEQEVERLQKLEKNINSMKKTVAFLRRRNVLPSSFTSRPSSIDGQSNACRSLQLFDQIQDIFTVNPLYLTSPKSRPTLIMRELFRKSGHVDDWAHFFQMHTKLLKDFIGEFCGIDEFDFDHVWYMIEASMRQFPRDIRSNKKKKMRTMEACEVDAGTALSASNDQTEAMIPKLATLVMDNDS